jgi:hypothetical protein
MFIHEPHEYVSSDVCLDPKHEDLTELCSQELSEENAMGQMLTRSIQYIIKMKIMYLKQKKWPQLHVLLTSLKIIIPGMTHMT